MNQYLFSVHSVEGAAMPSPETIQRMYRDVDAFNTEMQKENAWVFAGGLHEPSTATVVRVDGAEPSFTDGPFAEAKEHLGGFWVLKARDLDAALALAVRAAKACGAPVEVRPFQDPAG